MRIAFFLLILLLLQALVYFTFRGYLRTTKLYKPGYEYWALIPFLLFNIPFIVINLVWGRHFAPPEWFKQAAMMPFFVWQGATFFIALWILIGKLIKYIIKLPVILLKIIKPIREKIKSLYNKKPVQTVDLTRRKFVRYSTMAFSAYAFGGSAYGVFKHDSYELSKKDIMIDNLPPSLKGLTITLLSDIHSGSYMDERDMRKYSEIVNELKSDIICIPGDFVNFQREDVHPLTQSFRDLNAKHGIYGTLGNHDFFQDGDYVGKAINNESPVQLLRNQHRKINVNGTDLFILGVDDTVTSGNAQNAVVMDYIVRMNEYLLINEPTYKDAPKILLCHKPYPFDEIAALNIFDLTLSGHTHGGQVVPFKFGNFNMSFAATVSKYIEGHYKTGKSNMYVSRGIGTVGLPIRINCPPEVTQITLV